MIQACIASMPIQCTYQSLDAQNFDYFISQLPPPSSVEPDLVNSFKQRVEVLQQLTRDDAKVCVCACVCVCVCVRVCVCACVCVCVY